VQTLPAYVVRTHIGNGSVEPSPTNDIYPSWYKQPSKSSGNQSIDVISNKLATDCTPSLAKKDTTNADAILFSGDKFVTGSTADTSAKDDVHKCDDTKPSIDLSTPANCSGSCQMTATITAGTHPLAGNTDKGAGKVNFIIDGQTVQAFDIDGRTSYTLSYTPTINGNKQVSAQVIDSVLYDASDSETVNFTATGGGSSISIVSPTSGQTTGAVANTTWTGGTAPFTVQIDGSNVAGCINIPAFFCAVPVPGAAGSAHTITVLNSSTSAAVSIKR
jgi:hypothetical protein